MSLFVILWWMQMDAYQGIRGAGGLKEQAPSRWLYVGFWACIVISVAVVLRRLSALAFPSRSAPPQLATLDAVFASHAALKIGRAHV